MSVSLDDLLTDEPHGTFHDAALRSVQIDYENKRLTAEFDVGVGDPDAADEEARERCRRSSLVVEGLKLWALEYAPGAESNSALWLSADGPLAESPTTEGKSLAERVGPTAVAWYLFFSDLNAFGYVAGDRAIFTWIEFQPRAA